MSLHNKIMNIPCDENHLNKYPELRTHYKAGHRDARHAAAELALKADAELEKTKELADKYKWQVRDTCVRAEKAESDIKILRNIAQQVHDRLLRGDSDQELLALLDQANASKP